MILKDRQIVEKLKITEKTKVLDVGGSMTQHETIHIDTLVDIIRPEKSPYGPSKLKAQRFVQLDITKHKLPFRDKEFDVCLCTHTLEDLTTPFLIIDEMSRVAKRGLIVTPSMGYDLVFSPIDYTEWLSGARRVPGQAHHKWFFIESKKGLEVIPKNYPVLYTSEFQVRKWLGEQEMVYFWENKIHYKEFISLNMHSLIDRYASFYKGNKKYITKGRTLIFLDNPVSVAKAMIKKVIKRGKGYKYRQSN